MLAVSNLSESVNFVVIFKICLENKIINIDIVDVNATIKFNTEKTNSSVLSFPCSSIPRL